MKGDAWKFEDKSLKTRSDAIPTCRNKPITSLEEFIQQIPPSLLRKSASQRAATKADEKSCEVRSGNSRGDTGIGNGHSLGLGLGSGAVYLQGLSSLRADLKTKWLNPQKAKVPSGSVLKCPLSGVTVANDATQRKRNVELTRRLYTRRKAQERKDMARRFPVSKSTSNVVRAKKAELVNQRESGSQTWSVRSRSCSRYIPETEGGEADSVLARLLKEKKKRVLMDNCVEGLKIGVSLNQEEVKSLIQSKKRAYTVAKLLKKKFDRAHTTNKEALKRVKALKLEKADLAEKLKERDDRLASLEKDVALIKSGGGCGCGGGGGDSSMSSPVLKIREKNLIQMSRENERLSKVHANQAKELSEALKKVKELKAQLEQKKIELEEFDGLDRVTLKDSKQTHGSREKEAGLKRRINILTALESRQRATVADLKAKLDESQANAKEMKLELEREIERLKEEIATQREALQKEKGEKEKLKSLATEYNKIIKCRNERISELSKLMEDQAQTIETAKELRGKEESLMREIEEENATLRHRIDKELAPEVIRLQELVQELREAKTQAEMAAAAAAHAHASEPTKDPGARPEKTVCGNCSAAQYTRRALRDSSSSDEENGLSHLIGDHKHVTFKYPSIQSNELSMMMDQRKQLQKDLESVKQEKDKFYDELKELQRENDDMLRRIADLSTELQKARTHAATPRNDNKINRLENKLRKSEKEWNEKLEKAKREKEDAIETAKSVTDKLVNCVASYQFETANLKKVQCMLVGLLNQKDAMLSVFDQKLSQQQQQQNENMLTYEEEEERSWLPIHNDMFHER